jgi:hypothetical protein
MTGPQSRSNSAQPLNVTVFVDFRLAASACVVMPIAAQTTTVIAIIRATVMLSPWLGPLPAGSQVKQAGSMLHNQKISPDARSNYALSVVRPLMGQKRTFCDAIVTSALLLISMSLRHAAHSAVHKNGDFRVRSPVLDSSFAKHFCPIGKHWP